MLGLLLRKADLQQGDRDRRLSAETLPAILQQDALARNPSDQSIFLNASAKRACAAS
jgi:hypothetical protein